MHTELYQHLGVEPNASADEIKKAYRKLAMRHHPDKADPSEKHVAEERFKQVNEAYATLSDPEKRGKYDRFGTTDPNAGVGPGGMDINDIFKNMFGGDGGGGFNPFVGGGFNPFQAFGGGVGGGHRHRGPGNDICHCDISFEELFNGVVKKIEFEVVQECQTCNGVGAIDPSDIIKCMQCGGKGVMTQQMGPMIIQTQCQACFGNCTTIKTNRACGNCKGQKYASYRKSVKLDVPKGIPDKFEYKLSGKGNYNREAKCLNDLVVIFSHKIPPNCSPVDQSDGSITYKMDVTLGDLLCGFNKTINIYGQDLHVVSQGYFNPSKQMQFVGKGLPKRAGGGHGDLKIAFNVVYENDARLTKYLDVFLSVFKRTAVSDQDASKSDVLRIVL